MAVKELACTTPEGLVLRVSEKSFDVAKKILKKQTKNVVSGAKKVILKVSNMEELYKLPWGKELRGKIDKTKLRFDGMPIYKKLFC